MASEYLHFNETSDQSLLDFARSIIDSLMPLGSLSHLSTISHNSCDTHMTHFMCKEVSEECISSASFCPKTPLPEFSQVSVFARTCVISVVFLSAFCNNVSR